MTKTPFGCKWQFSNTSPTYMYDTKLPFRAAKSPQIFRRLNSVVCRILKNMYDCTVIAHLDDFLIVGKSFAECSSAMNTLINQLRQLGFAINWSKVEGPCQQLVLVDSSSMTYFDLNRPQQNHKVYNLTIYMYIDL